MYTYTILSFGQSFGKVLRSRTAPALYITTKNPNPLSSCSGGQRNMFNSHIKHAIALVATYDRKKYIFRQCWQFWNIAQQNTTHVRLAKLFISWIKPASLDIPFNSQPSLAQDSWLPSLSLSIDHSHLPFPPDARQCHCLSVFLPSQGAIKVMREYSLSHSLDVSIDLTDVTLVSNDT